jgi:hypothetical protein
MSQTTNPTPTPPQETEKSGGSKAQSQKQGPLDIGVHLMIALIILVPYVIFVAFLVFSAPPTPTLETLAATYGSLAALVAGYYFGQAPVKDAIAKAQDASTQQQKLKGGVVDMMSEFSSIEKQLADLKNSIREMHQGNARIREESQRLSRTADTARIMDLVKPEILESQKVKVENNAAEIDATLKRIEDLRKNGLKLLE